MTDHDFRELLHDRVQDLTVPVPDLSGAAWDRARRIKHRRARMAVAAVAIVGVLAGAALWSPTDNRSADPVRPAPTPAPTSSPEPSPSPVAPYPGGGSRPDASYRGWPVFWGPLPEQEGMLPPIDSPLPTRIDLSAPASPLSHDPITSALAAYVITDGDGRQRVLLLARDGSLRSVDVTRLQPLLTDGGQDVSIARETLLSPGGQYLAFPQDGSVEVLTVATGAWRTIEVGGAPTHWLEWLGDEDLFLQPGRLGGQGPTYNVVTGMRNGGNGVTVPVGPFDPAVHVPVGRYRMGPLGTAQTWTAITGLPLPGDSVRSARVLVVDAFESDNSALLALGESARSTPRHDDCCSAQFWLDTEHIVYESPTDPRRLVAWRVGTHELAVVSTITGVPSQRLVSSYARVWN
jgi:hypothetical protein